MEYFIGRLARPLVGGVLLHKTLDIITYCNHQTSIHFAIGPFCVSEFRGWASRRLQDVLRFVYTHARWRGGGGGLGGPTTQHPRFLWSEWDLNAPPLWMVIPSKLQNTEVLRSNKWNAGNIPRRRQKEESRKRNNYFNKKSPQKLPSGIWVLYFTR